TGCRGAPSENVVGDGPEGKYVGAGGALVPACYCLRRQIDLGGVRKMILDMKRTGSHGSADVGSFAATRHLPVRDLKTRSVPLWVAYKDVLRRQASVAKAFAMGISHRLSELTDESQALAEGEPGEPLAKITIEAGSVGIMLEHECRAEFRLTVI